jgi:TRAP-type C4-dicarboxylate transport system substrate-binding protein
MISGARLRTDTVNRCAARLAIKLCAVGFAAAIGSLGGTVTVAKPLEVIVGGTAARGTAGEAQWLKFQRDAEAAGKGAIKMRMLIHGELGSEEQIVSGLRRGRVQYANLSALIASTIVPETALIYAPYLFESQAEADFVFDQYLTPEFRKLFAARGLEFIVWYELGFQQMWSRSKSLLTPADLRRVKFRISASKSSELLGKALGADLISLGYADIIPSLQTGLIAAGENGIPLYARTGIAPEAPHLTLTNHSIAMSVIVADKRWWDRQTPVIRKVLRDSYPTEAWIRQAVRAEIRTDLAAAAQLKFKAYTLTPTQRAQWIEVTRGTHAELIRSIGGESQRLYNGIAETKKAYAAQNRTAASR